MMPLLNFLLFIFVVNSKASEFDYDNLKQYIQQGLDAITQDALAQEDSRLFHNYKFNSGFGNREVLVVRKIRSDDAFNRGENVTEWQTISIPKRSIAVGKMPAGFSILSTIPDKTSPTGYHTSSSVVGLKFNSTAFTTYKQWNTETMKYDGFIIVATQNDHSYIQWLRVENNNDLERLLWWHVPQKVTHLRIIEHGNHLKLFVIYEKLENSDVAVGEIYNILFHKSGMNYTVHQKLFLDGKASSCAVNKYGSKLYLSIPQQIRNEVIVFQLNENKDKFELYQTIQSKNVDFVAGFNIAYRSFVAIGGLNPGIYRFTANGLKEENIFDIHLQEVTYVLPIPVKTYRDEVMLLVQHNINYTTHVAPYVKVLIYSNGVFYPHDEIPCQYLGVITNGATCMADLDLGTGIIGSAVLAAGEALGVLVPRFQEQSGLFIFDWVLEKVENPIAKKVDKVVKSRIKIENLIKQQQKIIEEIEDSLHNSLKRDRDNEVTGNWKINVLVAPNVVYEDYNYRPDYDREDYSENYSSDIMEHDLKNIIDAIDSLQGRINRETRTAGEYFDFDRIEIRGDLVVKDQTFVDQLYVDKINDEVFNEMVQDCVKKSENNYVIGTKTFRRPEVENINFENLNNISADNIAYISDNELHITGDVIFQNNLKIYENVLVLDDGFVNGMKLKEELVYMNSEYVYENLNFENIIISNLNNVQSINGESMTDIIKYKNLNYDGLDIETGYMDLSYINITTKKINGENFRNFINSLCHIDEECSIPGNVTINGKLKIFGSADINTLNDLRYPEEYLLPKDFKLHTKITGNKFFTGTVRVNEVDVNGLIDGLIPEDIITCTVNQIVDGNFTFDDLEITESFGVDGDILVGKNLKKFVPNPTLEATKHVAMDVLFTNIEVEGNVVVKNLFNSTTVEQWLEDVVYKDEDIVTINAEKKFARRIEVQSNLNIDSNKINNVDLRQLLTIDSDQIVPDKTLSGKIIIDNLEISGEFNKINLKQHFDDLIQLDRDEIINSELVFNQITTSVPQIMADEIHIGSVNDMNTSDLYFTVGDRVFKNVEFNKVKAEHAQFSKDFNYEIELFDIRDFAKTRFSLTKDQIITGSIRALNGSIENINTEIINGGDWSLIKEYLNISDNCYRKLMEGEFKIDELIVNGSINIDELNDYNLRKIYKNAFWINQTNEIFGKIVFEDEVSVKDVDVNTLNRAKFHDFINDIVLKNATSVDFKGEKVFHSGFSVSGNLNVSELNGIKIENILRKTGEQEIVGNMVVQGDVTVDEELFVHKYINGIKIKKIVDRFRVKDDSFIITGNVSFMNDITIENLVVRGKGNDIHSNEYLNNIVGVNDDVEIPGTTIFKRKVHIHKNFGVAETVDGVNLNTLMDNVILTSRDDFIQGKVIFTQDVIVEDTIELENDLETEIISGCDIQEWKNRAVYLEDGYLKGHLKFEDVFFKSNIDVEYLNNIDMRTLIPLRTNQTIESLTVGFMQVKNDFKVGNLISGFNFTKEFENSVLVDNDQIINSKLIFNGPVTVLHNLKTTNLVNGHDLQRIVTTNTDQNLSASYIFNGKVIIDSDLTVTGTVNRINVTDWRLRTVTGIGAPEQNIHDSWVLRGNVTFQQDVAGNGLLGGIQIKKLADEANWKQRDKFEVEDKIKAAYQDNCLQVQNMLTIAKTRPLLFKYLEYQTSLHFNQHIAEIHHFKYNYRYFLLVNLKNNCKSLLYEWIPNSFDYVTSLDTGEVEQFVTVYNEHQVYLVTKHPSLSTCKNVGVNVWIFGGDSLTHIHALNNTIKLARANLPGTFYSLDLNFVTEYKLFYQDDNPVIQEYKQWNIPRLHSTDTKLGMSLKKFVSPVDKKESAVEYYYEAPDIIEEISTGMSGYLPELFSKEIIEFNITYQDTSIGMTAVAVWENALVGGMTDEIKIYKNLDDRLFDKITTYRPSNLNILSFGESGETFLAFLENNDVLKLYQADGNGFKPRTVVKRPATKMLTVSLPLAPYQLKRKFLVLINGAELIFLQAVMDGDRSTENFYCEP